MSECIFCRIIEGTIEAKKVYEDALCLAFDDVNPQAPIHVLVIPKQHVESLKEFQERDAALLGHLLQTCTTVARQKEITETGYRVVANTGKGAGQTVFHLHLHVLGGRMLNWPPG